MMPGLGAAFVNPVAPPRSTAQSMWVESYTACLDASFWVPVGFPRRLLEWIGIASRSDVLAITPTMSFLGVQLSFPVTLVPSAMKIWLAATTAARMGRFVFPALRYARRATVRVPVPLIVMERVLS